VAEKRCSMNVNDLEPEQCAYPCSRCVRSHVSDRNTRKTTSRCLISGPLLLLFKFHDSPATEWRSSTALDKGSPTFTWWRNIQEKQA